MASSSSFEEDSSQEIIANPNLLESRGRCTRHQVARMAGMDPKVLYGNKKYMSHDDENVKVKHRPRKVNKRIPITQTSGVDEHLSEDDMIDVKSDMDIDDVILMINMITNVVTEIVNKHRYENVVKIENEDNKTGYYTRASSLKTGENSDAYPSGMNVDGITIDLDGLYKLCKNPYNYDSYGVAYLFMEYIAIRTDYYHRTCENMLRLVDYLGNFKSPLVHLLEILIKYYTKFALLHLTHLRNLIPIKVKKAGVLNFKYWKMLVSEERLDILELTQILINYKFSHLIPKTLLNSARKISTDTGPAQVAEASDTVNDTVEGVSHSFESNSQPGDSDPHITSEKARLPEVSTISESVNRQDEPVTESQSIFKKKGIMDVLQPTHLPPKNFQKTNPYISGVKIEMPQLIKKTPMPEVREIRVEGNNKITSKEAKREPQENSCNFDITKLSRKGTQESNAPQSAIQKMFNSMKEGLKIPKKAVPQVTTKHLGYKGKIREEDDMDDVESISSIESIED